MIQYLVRLLYISHVFGDYSFATKKHHTFYEAFATSRLHGAVVTYRYNLQIVCLFLPSARRYRGVRKPRIVQCALNKRCNLQLPNIPQSLLFPSCLLYFTVILQQSISQKSSGQVEKSRKFTKNLRNAQIFHNFADYDNNKTNVFAILL